MRTGDRLDRRQARSVRDLVALLSTIPVDGRPALEAHIGEIRKVLEVEVAVAYGVIDAGDHLDLRFIHGAGTVGVDFLRIRKAFGGWLGDFPGKTGWAAYNPVRPEREQRNRVRWAGRDPHSNTLRPVARALYPRFGIAAFDQMRTLICEGPTLLAWVGAFQSDALAPWQRSALGSLIRPLRKRLIVERWLERYRRTQAALEVLLESTASAVFILGERGAVEPGNGLARAALRADRKGTLEALRAARREGGEPSAYTVTSLDTGDAVGSYLAIARAPCGPLHRAKAAAAKSRFRLSERQTEVLELLLQGSASKEICGALGIFRSTLEKHLAAMFDRVGVENRYALIARVTAL